MCKITYKGSADDGWQGAVKNSAGKVIWACGHYHHNRDHSGRRGVSAVDCAKAVVAVARGEKSPLVGSGSPEFAEQYAAWQQEQVAALMQHADVAAWIEGQANERKQRTAEVEARHAAYLRESRGYHVYC